MPSKSARMKAMVVVRPTCGGPKKTGLVPRGTSFYGQWFMQSRGAQKVNKFIYPESCIGAPHKTGIAGCLRYLLKHIKEINARINWGLDKVFPGLDPKLGPRIPWWKKHLVLGAWEDAAGIASLLMKSAPDPAHPFAESDFWGIDYRNYSGKLKNCIRKVNAAIPNGTVEGSGKGEVTGLPENTPWALGQHYLGLLTEQEINEVLLPNFYGIFLGERIMWVVDDVRLPIFDNAATTQGWEVVESPGGGSQVSSVALDGANLWVVFGDEPHPNIYYGLTYDETVNWNQKPGYLDGITVAGDWVFGYNAAGDLYQASSLGNPNNDWVQVGGANKVIGIGASDKYLCVTTEPSNKFGGEIWYTVINNPLVPHWKHISGGLVKVSVGGKYIYGCNNNGNLYRAEWSDTDDKFGEFVPITHSNKVISVSTDGEIVWITTTETSGGNIYYASADNEAHNMHWNKIQAMDPNNLSGGLNLTQVYTGLSWTYGVSGSGVLYRRQTGRLFLSFEKQLFKGSADQGMKCLPGCQDAYPGDEGNSCTMNVGAVAMGDKFIKACISGLTIPDLNISELEEHWDAAATFVSKAGILISDRYLQIDATPTSPWCGNGKSQADCTAGIENFYTDVKNLHTNEPSLLIKGLYFESTGLAEAIPPTLPGEIVFHTINYLATKYSLKRMWTFSINKAHTQCPKNFCENNINTAYPPGGLPPGDENYDTTSYWDYCLGQSYTNNTLEFYINDDNGVPSGCEINSTTLFKSWDANGVTTSDMGVVWTPPYTHNIPMVCGGGNCQADSSCCHKPCTVFSKFNTEINGGLAGCQIDERLTFASMKKLLANYNRRYANMGIWYGNYGPVYNKKNCKTLQERAAPNTSGFNMCSEACEHPCGVGGSGSFPAACTNTTQMNSCYDCI